MQEEGDGDAGEEAEMSDLNDLSNKNGFEHLIKKSNMAQKMTN